MIRRRVDALEARLPFSDLTPSTHDWTDDEGREHRVHVIPLDDEQDANRLRAVGVNVEALAVVPLADARPARVLHFGCCSPPEPLPGSKLARLAELSARRGARAADGREDRERSTAPVPVAVTVPVIVPIPSNGEWRL